MKTLLLPLALLLVTLAHAKAEDGPGHGSGPAHPSAFLCEKLGVPKVSADGPEGSFNYCILDEAKMNSMSLWISLNGHMELAANTYLTHPVPPPEIRNAAAYCTFVGGEPHTFISYDRLVRADECIFNEKGHRSSIDQLTLFRGPHYSGNQRLTQLLRGL